VVTPRHSIKLSERVVSVVPKAPKASADCCNQNLYVLMLIGLTPAPRDFGVDSTGAELPCRSISTDSAAFFWLISSWGIGDAIVEQRKDHGVGRYPAKGLLYRIRYCIIWKMVWRAELL
jgi:hypothetical protein